MICWTRPKYFNHMGELELCYMFGCSRDRSAVANCAKITWNTLSTLHAYLLCTLETQEDQADDNVTQMARSGHRSISCDFHNKHTKIGMDYLAKIKISWELWDRWIPFSSGKRVLLILYERITLEC